MAIDTLQSAVQSTLSAFLHDRLSTNDDLHADVYRTIRDVANLLLEKQLVCEAFDKDPFELMTTRRHGGGGGGGDDGDDGAEAPVTGRLRVGKGAEEENDDLDEEVADEDHADDKDNHDDDDDDDDIDDDLLEKRKNAELIARVKVRDLPTMPIKSINIKRRRRLFLTLYQNPISLSYLRPHSMLYHVHELLPLMGTVPSTQYYNSITMTMIKTTTGC